MINDLDESIISLQYEATYQQMLKVKALLLISIQTKMHCGN